MLYSHHRSAKQHPKPAYSHPAMEQVTPKQLNILLLLYRFRFLNRIQTGGLYTSGNTCFSESLLQTIPFSTQTPILFGSINSEALILSLIFRSIYFESNKVKKYSCWHWLMISEQLIGLKSSNILN